MKRLFSRDHVDLLALSPELSSSIQNPPMYLLTEPLKEVIKKYWKNGSVLIFIGSVGAVVRIINPFIKDKENGTLNHIIDENIFNSYLQTNSIPEPELMIRTSGEYRMSNFLLWQLAYAEIYVTDTVWPDFDVLALTNALLDYQSRHRRFGGV